MSAPPPALNYLFFVILNERAAEISLSLRGGHASIQLMKWSRGTELGLSGSK